VVVHKTEKSTAGLFPQYFWSFAKRDDDAAHTSRGTFLYFFFYELGDAWQVGTNPTITFNEEGSSGNKWNVPVGVTIAKTVKFGKRIVKFQIGIEHSIERQDDYGRETVIKLNVIPVIADPFKSPIFD
jgi:hypothetical protein